MTQEDLDFIIKNIPCAKNGWVLLNDTTIFNDFYNGSNEYYIYRDSYYKGVILEIVNRSEIDDNGEYYSNYEQFDSLQDLADYFK